jgi:predicted nucleic acid-binding Zn ribbon protein
MSDSLQKAELQPEAARALVKASLEASRNGVCRVCGRPLRGRQQQVCSGRCRAAQSRERKARAEVERRREVLALLSRALQLLEEDISLLNSGEGPST